MRLLIDASSSSLRVRLRIAGVTLAAVGAVAAAIRPELVGQALKEISADPEVANALFSVLEAQKLIDNPGEVILIPENSGVVKDLLAVL
jgi:hypothetical protein